MTRLVAAVLLLGCVPASRKPVIVEPVSHELPPEAAPLPPVAPRQCLCAEFGEPTIRDLPEPR